MTDTKPPVVHPVVYVKPKSLKGSSYNPRKIDKKELEKLARNIAVFGFVEAVTASKEDGELIGGHQRVRAAMLLNEGKYIPVDSDGGPLQFNKPTEIPVIYIEGLTLTQRKTLNLSLNRISGEWDEYKLNEIINELRLIDEINLSYTGFDDSELKKYLNEEESPVGKYIGAICYNLMVECKNDHEQGELLKRLEEEGFKCQVLMF